MTQTVEVGTAVADPGRRGQGVLKIAEIADGNPLALPVMIVNGAGKGPTLWVDASVHGDEYEGVEAIFRLYETLDPKKIKGAVIMVPVVNIPAFEAGLRVNPADHQNLNRCFPGRPSGFLSEQLAYIYFQELSSKADYLLDLHSAGMVQTLLPCALFFETGDEKKDKGTMDLAKAFGVDVLWKAPFAGMLTSEAAKKGIPAICTEIGGEGRCLESYVQLDIKGVTNVMKRYGMLEGKPELPSSYTVVEESWMYSKNGGFLRPEVKLRDRVSKGDTLGRIMNIHGKEAERVAALHDGIVIGIRTFPSLNAGDWTFFVGKVVQTIKP